MPKHPTKSRALTPEQFRSMCRGHTEAAIRTAVGLMTNEETPPSSRLAAAQFLVERGWGKPTQPHSTDPESPLEMIHRVIIGSRNSNG